MYLRRPMILNYGLSSVMLVLYLNMQVAAKIVLSARPETSILILMNSSQWQ